MANVQQRGLRWPQNSDVRADVRCLTVGFAGNARSLKPISGWPSLLYALAGLDGG